MLRWLNFSSCYSMQFWGFCIVITILYITLDIRIDNINMSKSKILNVLLIVILVFLLFIILGLMTLASRGLL